MKRRFIAVMLCFCMAASFFATSAYGLNSALECSEAYQRSSFFHALSHVQLSGDWHTDIVNIALSQVGYHEGDNTAEYGGENAVGWHNFIEYSSAYFHMNGEWCAMFISWCARQAEIPKYVINTAARASVDSSGKYSFHLSAKKPASYTPDIGDLVFFSRTGYGTQHVGLVAKLMEDGFYTVEGNCLNAVRIMYYSYDEPTIRYYGVYQQPNLEQSGSAQDFSVTVVEFACRDGARGVIPDEPHRQYEFEKLWACHGTQFTVPSAAFVREDAELLGYAVQDCSNGKWLASDLKWYSPAEVLKGKTLYTVREGTNNFVDGFWTETEQVKLYPLWNVDGKTELDSSAAVFRKDDTGWENPYSDVSEKDWYYSAFRDAYRKGVYRGVTAAYPYADASRGEFVSMLYALAGKPNVDNIEQAFTDLKKDDAVYDAARWAYSKGIVKGMENNVFDAAGKLSREQAVTMLYRISGETAVGTELPFSDAAQVSAWAVDALQYAYQNGWAKGSVDAKNDLKFFPQNAMNRAEEVSFAIRAAEMLKNK